jgi:hypothetical protein
VLKDLGNSAHDAVSGGCTQIRARKDLFHQFKQSYISKITLNTDVGCSPCRVGWA